MSEKHDQEYFADGMAEEIIDLLAKVHDLHVPARYTVATTDRSWPIPLKNYGTLLLFQGLSLQDRREGEHRHDGRAAR